MSAHDRYVWAVIVGLAAVVVLSRSCFMLLPSRLRPGARAEPWLRYAPLAALAALVAPEAFGPAAALLGAPQAGDAAALAEALLADARAPSALAMLAAGLWRRSSLAALLAGVAVFLALRATFGPG